jgi:uncharacterized membrane protein YvbJ|tara:strand:- start:218 stop:448 length:231 start_codon:yes stop_codon:yes gene_type:complete
MALINCPECKNEVSNKAEKCPKCAYPINPSKPITKKVVKEVGNKSSEGLFLKTLNTGCFVLILIIIFIITFIIFSS